MHWREHPAQAEHCGHLGEPGDGVCIGFRNGTDAIVQYGFHRDDQLFTDRDLALLAHDRTGSPATGARTPHSHAPLGLTLTERRVLSHVAAGRSNAQIAETLCISVGTVRKHLEHAYRKLGVSNRIGAVARLRGCDEPSLGPARPARQIRLKANTQLIPRGRIQGMSRRTEHASIPDRSKPNLPPRYLTR